jgi:hypothetical protein
MRVRSAFNEDFAPEPAAFTRYAIYAFIGLADVFVLFIVSISVEARIRNQAYAPEWR